MTYSQVSRVRDLSGLTDTEFTTVNGAATTEITLRRDFIEITSVYINGSLTTAFTAVRPRKITFDSPPGNHAVIQVDYDVLFTDTQIDDFIDDADATIDGYLNDIFTVPFTSPYPALIQTISAELAASKILQALASKLNRVESNELANDLRAQALETIGLLQSGKITIPGIDSGSKTGINVSTKGKKKVFRTRPDLNETWHEFHDGFDRDEGQDYGNGDIQSTSA